MVSPFQGRLESLLTGYASKRPSVRIESMGVREPATFVESQSTSMAGTQARSSGQSNRGGSSVRKPMHGPLSVSASSGVSVWARTQSYRSMVTDRPMRSWSVPLAPACHFENPLGRAVPLQRPTPSL